MGVLDFINTGLQAGSQVLNQINQKKQWEREDTAVQRRVADLKAAGLSPVLAAGSAASSSSPIRIEAPKFSRDVEAQSAGIAQTKMEREWLKTKQDIERATNREALNREYVLDQDAENEGTMAWDLARSQIGRAIEENREVVRNIGIYRNYGVPSTTSAGDAIITDSILLKKLFPELNAESTAGLSVLGRLLTKLLGGVK